jgi:hypothetical protein
MIRRRTLVATGLAAAFAAALPAAAVTRIEGVAFDDTARIAGQDLRLNGVGVRAVAWLKGYAAGLYLTSRATTAESVVATPGAKRLRLVMLQSVSAEEFVKAIVGGLPKNTPPDVLPTLADREMAFQQSIRSVGQVRKGDVADLDFVPGRGLVFTYNAKARGEPIPGEDFYDAVLGIFIGARPVDKALKAGLLGQAAP